MFENLYQKIDRTQIRKKNKYATPFGHLNQILHCNYETMSRNYKEKLA